MYRKIEKRVSEGYCFVADVYKPSGEFIPFEGKFEKYNQIFRFMEVLDEGS
jgi:hypothetical protein